MTTSPPSSSESFHRLHPEVRRWIWEKTTWQSLRPAQEAAIPPVLDRRDVLISAATAGGKTEAAYLPIFSAIVGAPSDGIRVLNISPLRALINDQHERLAAMGDFLGVEVHKWHGDVAAHAKRKVVRNPAGVLLITPESLEALFVLRASATTNLFRNLDFVVVDELHVFIGTERGRHLQSLLHRVDTAVHRRIPRVAMSATLGQPALAMEFLRPCHGDEVVYVERPGDEREIRLVIRGYQRARQAPIPTGEPGQDEPEPDDEAAIRQHLFATLRGKRNLVFANSRRSVESYAGALRRTCEERNLPEEFFAHHGSLSREYREDAERALKDETRPATLVCTSTLELGIDVGSVESVAQIGVPQGVASLRQRLGRSGRQKDKPAILRMYITEDVLDGDAPIEDVLRVQLVQSIAVVRLLLRGWFEPPRTGMLHLSTLVQQTLSLVAQHGGVFAKQAWRLLCESGPFDVVNPTIYGRLLRAMAAKDLLVQSHDGSLVLGLTGERLVNHYDFYAVFMTPDEWRIVAGGKALGALPITNPVTVDSFLILAGRRWRVVGVDEESRVIDVVPAPGGRAPFFEGEPGLVHDGIREEMRSVYEENSLPAFLDPRATTLLLEGREGYARMELRDRVLLERGDGCWLFPWVGDRAMNTLVLSLKRYGLKVDRSQVAITFAKATCADVAEALRRFVDTPTPDPSELLTEARNLARNKYDGVLDDELLRLDVASSDIDLGGARVAAERVLAMTR